MTRILPLRRGRDLTTEPAAPVMEDVQGNILRGYRCASTAYVFLSVVDPTLAKEWLLETADHVTSAVRRPEGVAANVAVTASGLARLGVPARRLAWLPRPFLEGMAARAADLGDPTDAEGRPVGWHPPFDSDGLLHILLTLAGDDADVDARLTELEDGMWQSGLMLIDTIRTKRLEGEVEHFGFRDGISQPLIEGVHDAAAGGAYGSTAMVPPGQFVIGMPGEVRGVVEPLPALTRGGSYLVLRKLEQDVAAFRSLVAGAAGESGLDPGLVAAKLMGRWPDGTPLAVHPEGPVEGWMADPTTRNAFDFSADADGARCPIGSHVRRANPRGSLAFDGALERRHRIVRRGMPYGPLYDDDPSAERGLVFVCYQRDIADQFEFVQSQWLGDGNVFALGADRDPVVAEPQGGSGIMRIEGRPAGDDTDDAVPPVFVESMTRCVTSRGGEYLLVPSIPGLRWLGGMP